MPMVSALDFPASNISVCESSSDRSTTALPMPTLRIRVNYESQSRSAFLLSQHDNEASLPQGNKAVCTVAVFIQSRSSREEAWQDEGSKRNHFKAYLTALAKSRITGRVYRLLTSDGDVLEQIDGSANGGKVDSNAQAN